MHFCQWRPCVAPVLKTTHNLSKGLHENEDFFCCVLYYIVTIERVVSIAKPVGSGPG